MKRLFITSFIAICLSICLSSHTLKSGDLIFEIATDSEMSRAISDATAQTDSIKFSHVGIIAVDKDGNIEVIEATGKYGVVATPIDTFITKAKSGAVVKRISHPFPAEEAVSRAKSYIGRDYDWWYLPDNDEIYCSELVEKAFINSDGTSIFSTIPMNFRDSDGNIPQFWKELFARLGRRIPEGVPGTNPTQISHDSALITIKIIKDGDTAEIYN